ncbi:DNA polymerase III subunit gamma and tau [Knoellia subterranea]|uniref:DNA polymerase III subunit gamma/tau n=1 Tax=Knoellia subterranea KCTC 19937 TaxID=1385521 RepID=A0A0A0JKX3_9MICO|nr:DNA polymerase III subunit gamma and tau [Knoellia subterranea]KGN38045.1 DNA polymerase III subunit gamma/tau [Knoellia subterranea KCTC 19937]
MSTALYRRYRPETFADVIGQEHVTEPLMQALRTGRVNHAYLFSGPRGCGKTTSARILARCLNCEQGPTPTPCGECDSCVALARGGPGTVDVIEIDAASHGGVDDARDLRERASYGPAQSRYKIYIIDEAHMVTPQGFNALLKIVEEPPEHVKFVFATTEPEKVIGTIRSRTHHYPFRLVPPGQLTDYMERLCAAEGVSVAPGVLSFVVRAGGGSVRDSLSVLDQLIAGSGDEGLTYESAAALLGFTDGELLDAAIDAFGAGDGAGAFSAIERVIETGLDPRRFIEDLLERLRDLIVVAAVPDGASAVLRALPPDQLERMRQQAAAFGGGALSRAADVVNAGLSEMTGATAPRLQLELIAARLLLPAAAGETGYAARLDRLERRLDVGGVPTGAAAPPALSVRPAAAPAQPTPQVAPAQPAAPAHPVAPAVQASTEPDRRPPVQTVPAAVPTPSTVDHSEEPPEPDEPEFLEPQPPRTAPAPSPASAPVQKPPTAGPGSAPSIDHGSPAQVQGHVQTHAQAPVPTPADQPPARPGGMDTAAIRRSWPDVLAKVFELRRTTWTFVSEHAQVMDFDGERLLLGISTTGLTNTFRRGPHATYVQQALIDVLGIDTRVEGVPADGSALADGQGVATIDPSRLAAPAPQQSEPAPQAQPSAKARAEAHGAAAAQAAAAGGPTHEGERPAYAQDQPPSTQADWGTGPADGASAPAWATAQVDEPVSPFARAKEVVAAEPDPDETPVADDSAISEDDEDIEGLGEVGVPVVERILGGRVIHEEDA